MTTAFYRVGTISAQLNSKVVTGHGTSWTLGANKVISGDVLLYNNSKMYEVEHVISDTEIHLFTPFQDANITQQPYAILRNASLNISSRIAASVAIAINQKQQQLNEFNAFLTSTAPTVNMTDATGNVIAVIPIPTLVKTINDLVNDASTITAVVQEGKTARDQAVAAKNASETALASVTTIKSEVTQLKTDVEGLKTDTETAKSAAASSASAAAGSVTAAAAEVAKAATEVSNAAAEVTKAKAEVQHAKDQVAIAAGHASASATSESNAGASATAAANSAQLAQAAIVPMRNEAEMWEMIRRNKDKYAASQFVHFGTHVNSSAWGHANEGMFVDSTSSSSSARGKILMGEISNPTGTSKTNFPVTMVAGFISKLLGLTDQVGFNSAQILLPEAPDGTVIYDSTGSARGTGKANIDLLNEVDPKYGNAAKDHGGKSEAIARAFEGQAKNGDLRAGSASWGAVGWTFNGGKARNANTGFGSFEQSINVEVGATYEVSVYVSDWAGQDYTINAGSLGNAGRLTGIGLRTFSFKAATSTILVDLRPYTGGQSGHIELDSFFVVKKTEEVVITPHDVFGMEFWLEEVSQANPDVFDCGMVQSKATSSNGVATSASSRPQTYHAAFKGDTTTGHKSVNFFTATFEQQCKLAAKEENNLFRLNDGRIVQWRGRQETFRGPGNGEWAAINPADPSLLAYSISAPVLRVLPQGKRDSIAEVIGSGAPYYYSTKHPTNGQPHNGIFTSSNTNGSLHSSVGEFGLCFFQVWGEVPRLSDSAYHPSFSPMGAAYCKNISGTHGNWYATDRDYRSTLDCFLYKVGGDIASGLSGRPDGRYFDQPYSNGQGGIIDYRVSAHDMGSNEDAVKVFQKVVNKKYRGKECLVKTTPSSSTILRSGVYSGYSYIRVSGTYAMEPTNPEYRNARGYVVSETGVVYEIFTAYSTSGETEWQVRPINGYGTVDLASFGSGKKCYAFLEEVTNQTVSDDFTMTDVIGPPMRILSTPQLANGWIGRWIHTIPAGSTQHYELTREMVTVGNTFVCPYTRDNGNSWSSQPLTINAANNTVSANWSSDHVWVVHYIAFSNQFKTSSNKAVLNCDAGLGYVWASADNYLSQGNGLIEGLLGKVGKDNQDGNQERRYALRQHFFMPEGKLKNVSTLPVKHEPIDLARPLNNSPAVKVLWSQAANNQQATLQFNWNELVWRDIPAFKVDDGQPGKITRNTGDILHVTDANTNLQSRLVLWINSSSYGGTINYEEVYVDGNNDIRLNTNGNVSGNFVLWNGNGWGDDSTIRIKDGVGTFINLNGDTCLYGTSELAIPYGYTKNQARAGSQVAGVDL
ncbi:hypothetical protein [Vibrio owensii]|uniref:hypothetical protein n=1 Tax=Vibrio owensii TaxID=696485 RepID=UPI003CE546CA